MECEKWEWRHWVKGCEGVCEVLLCASCEEPGPCADIPSIGMITIHYWQYWIFLLFLELGTEHYLQRS